VGQLWVPRELEEWPEEPGAIAAWNPESCRTGLRAPHWGQRAGASDAERARNSKRVAHFLHWYSNSGIGFSLAFSSFGSRLGHVLFQCREKCPFLLNAREPFQRGAVAEHDQRRDRAD